MDELIELMRTVPEAEISVAARTLIIEAYSLGVKHGVASTETRYKEGWSDGWDDRAYYTEQEEC